MNKLLRNGGVESAERSVRRRGRLNRGRIVLEALESRALLATIVVDSPLDNFDPLNPVTDGLVTLREAMLAANLNTPVGDAPAGDPGLDFIHFDLSDPTIPIELVAALPTVQDPEPLTIDGTTQPGYVTQPLIEIAGSGAGTSVDGFVFATTGSTIQGLIIHGFDGSGILLEGGSGNAIYRNYIGTDRSGTAASPNTGHGILLRSSFNNSIGGALPGTDSDANVISGNLGHGVLMSFSQGNELLGNLIGTDYTGTIAVGNQGDGIRLTDSSLNVIGLGGQNFNLISGNRMNGVSVFNSGSSNFLSGNFISGNRIGTDIIGLGNLGNAMHGVYLEDTFNTLVGGDVGNIIRYSGGDGVRVTLNSFSGTFGNSILNNSISNNGGLGIDLGGDGVTPNDPGDQDFGPNDFQNYPVISNVARTDSGLLVSGTLDVLPNPDLSNPYVIQIFADSGDPTGYGEGLQFLGSTTVDPTVSNDFSVLVNPPVNDTLRFITATATSPDGSTSEFSLGYEFATDLVLTKTQSAPDAEIFETLTYTLTVQNGGPQLAFNAIVTDPLPSGFVLISSQTSQGTLTFAQGVVTANLGDLPVGATATITLVVQPTIPGQYINRAEVTSLTPELVPGDNESEVATAVLDFDFVVRNTNNDGRNSLRRAIENSNRNPGVDTILFDIPEPGPHIIFPFTPLPNLKDSVIVNGRSQPGLPVTVDGSLVDGFSDGGLVFTGGNSALNGLSIRNFRGSGVVLLGVGGNVIEGNWIGTDITGQIDYGNLFDGIVISNSADNIIGGQTLLNRNIISGNDGNGIRISGDASTGNLVLGNLIGVNQTQTAGLGNGQAGVYLTNLAHQNRVGGSQPGSGNVIAANGSYGVVAASLDPEIVFAQAGATGQNTVVGNLIGLTSTSTLLPNTRAGIYLEDSPDNIVGGPAGDANTIFGASGAGVWVYGAGSSRNLIAGNRIGTDAAGAVDAGASGIGILVEANASANQISSNRVAAHGAAGIALANLASGNQVIDNQIGSLSGNSETLGFGLLLQTGASGTLVSGNTITGNRHGVLIATGATQNRLVRNRIGRSGIDPEEQGNSGAGVFISNAPSNQIGSESVSEGNLISGNAYGIVLQGADSTNTAVVGNVIGLNANGTAAIPNAFTGVLLEEAPGNRIVSNLVSGNGGAGIHVMGAGAGSNILDRNRVGTDSTGRLALGNARQGILIELGASNQLRQNHVSGNLDSGIEVAFASGTLILGNTVGTNTEGTTPLPNRADGILARSTIGSDIRFNLVSGNLESGIHLLDSSGGQVLFNASGTSRAGTQAIGNQGDGIFLERVSSSTVTGNLASGNGNVGIQVLGTGSTSNTIFSNVVGTDLAGIVPLANFRVGIYVNGASNLQIGGPASGQGNLISGNQVGVQITESSGVILQGNRIGTSADGLFSMPGSQYGVLIESGVGNSIGTDGTLPPRFGDGNAGNLIAGNSIAGVYLFGPTSSNNQIAGNGIGTDATGLVPLPNGEGVLLDNAPANVLEGNLVSGNVLGVRLSGPTARGNVLRRNIIGVGRDGVTPVRNLFGGLFLSDSPGNLVGGTLQDGGNLISGNGGTGVQVFGPGASGNIIAGNWIGTDFTATQAIGNLQGGIFVNNAPQNTIGGTSPGSGNLISANFGSGVVVSGPLATGVVVTGNVIGIPPGSFDSRLGNDVGVFINETRVNVGIGTLESVNDIRGNRDRNVVDVPPVGVTPVPFRRTSRLRFTTRR